MKNNAKRFLELKMFLKTNVFVENNVVNIAFKNNLSIQFNLVKVKMFTFFYLNNLNTNVKNINDADLKL
jgi:hypothetical protein